jgi:hypothetical protein
MLGKCQEMMGVLNIARGCRAMLRRHKEKHWPMLRRCWVLLGSIGEALLDFRQGKSQGCWDF